jgi:parallel beta-helix repeat protein
MKKLFITLTVTLTLLTTNSYAARDRTPPTTPTTLTATSTNTTVTLTWKQSTDNIAVKGYNIYRAQTRIGTSPTTNYNDTTITPATTYTYSISAYDAAGNPSARSKTLTITTKPNPPPPPPTYNFPQLPPATCGTECTTFTACGLLPPGNYTLLNDVTSTGTCITITSTTTLDCGGHSITSDLPVDVTGANGFKIRNCVLTAPLQAVRVQNSSGILQQNTFTGTYEQYYTTNTRLSGNTFNSGINAGAGLINTAFGSSNTIDNNIMNGLNITDDGILLQGETGDIISSNTISNVWDCGIETLFTIQNTLITHNTITNAAKCGIGGWFYSNWRTNQIETNTVTNSPYMFFFFRNGILPNEPTVYFDNNTFTGNIASTLTDYGAYIDVSEEDNTLPAGSVVANGNIFTRNNFNSRYSPIMWPASLPVDGGGNICGPSTFPHNMSLLCHV